MRTAILVAAGTGERFGRPGGKQLAGVGGVTVAGRALAALAAAATIDTIIVVCHPGREDDFRRDVVTPDVAARTTVVPGGATRRLSVAAGLAALPDSVTVVVVHDGARPLTEPALIDRAVRELEQSPNVDGIVVGHPAYDTIKTVDPAGLVVATPDREGLWVAQTPQVFRAGILREAHARAAQEGLDTTDDASMVERVGGTIRMMEGTRWNLKVTVPEDMELVEALLARRANGGV